MAVAHRWKCGVCSAKAGDLVCSRCVTQEAERRRVERAERLGALRAVRDAAAVAMQERQGAVQREAHLQKEAADECRLKEQVREVTKRVAEERIKVASAAFALKHHRDLLAAAESQLTREQMSAAEMKEALLDGLRRHSEDAARTLGQRRWRKLVQLFVLLPVAPSIPMSGRSPAARRSAGSEEFEPGDGGGSGGGGGVDGRQGSVGGGGRHGEGGRSGKRGAGLLGGGAAATVSGVSTLLDLPLPNNGDYSHVPADVLMAALALLARLLVGVASCLGVSLPHPLFPAASTRYAAISVDSPPRERSSQYPLCPPSKMAEIGVMGATSSVCNAVGAFETALDLLRSDVVHLCVEGAKVPVDRLWPAEALLLNLWELQQHAISELRSSSPVVDVPVPMPRDPPERADGQQQAILGGGRLSSVAFNDSFHRSGGAGGAGAGRGAEGTAGRDWVPQGGQDGRRAPSSLDPTSAAAAAAAAAQGGAEDEEATYEFVVGDGVVESGNGGATGRGWSSWGSRLAATGSGGRLSG